jgi:hypothetical protein
MSILHMSLVMDHLDASPAVKLVALLLADHCDAEGYCWPSYRRLAEKSCLSERTVARHVHELIASGLLVKVRSGRMSWRDGRPWRVTNAYRMSAEALESLPPLISPEVACPDQAEVVTDGQVATCGRPKVVSSGRGGWSAVTTKPPVEPSLSEEHSLSETGVSDAPSRTPRVSARRDADWEQRAEEVLSETAFPSRYRELGELLAAANKSGRVTLSRVVRELYEPLIELERGVGSEAMRAGLRAAIARPAPNANYVRKAAKGYAERPAAVAVTSRTINRSDYDDFCTGGEL